MRALSAARGAGGLALILLCTPHAADAQGWRGTATTSTRFVELRALHADTVDPASVVQDAEGRWTVSGIPVNCRPALPCVVFRPGQREQGVTLTQDVRFTAWGLGVRGLSATAFMRLRTRGGDFAWPRSDDAFDALIAYAEYDRAPMRWRLGRQMTTAGLGFSSFDGASALYRAGPAFSAELYGGRSLARGLYEPRADVLRGFDELVTDPTVVLLGAAAEARPVHGIDLAARYQRELFADRSALASERASFDIAVTRFPSLTVLGSIDYDFAFGRVGKSDVRARAPLTTTLTAELRLRRYVPYFELWTIWGFFDPVGYRDAEAVLSWRRGTTLEATVTGALRRYDETGAAVLGPTLERDTRRFTLSGSWQPSGTWRFDAALRRETGFGASFGGGDASARWQAGSAGSVRGWLTVFEQIEEFRVGEGSVAGAGLDGSVRLGPRWVLEGGAGIYRHGSTRADSPDWNQRRAWLGARVEFGSDPGLRPLSRTP